MRNMYTVTDYINKLARGARKTAQALSPSLLFGFLL